MFGWKRRKEKKKVVRPRCFLPKPTKCFLPKMRRTMKRKLELCPLVHNSMTVIFFFLPLIFTFLMSFSYSSICSICLWNQTGGFSFFPSQKKKNPIFLFVFVFVFVNVTSFFLINVGAFFFFFFNWTVAFTHTYTHTHIYIYIYWKFIFLLFNNYKKIIYYTM